VPSIITKLPVSANSSETADSTQISNSNGLNDWIARLYQNADLLRMGHAQRLVDLNLGMGWLYYGLARLIRPQKIVVIGSWRGFVPLVFGKALADNLQQGSVLFIDPSLVDDFWKDPVAVRDHFSQHGVTNVDHFLMTTQQFVETETYRSLGETEIVMIDGYHTAQQARYDYEAFERLVPPHGVILLHDSLNVGTVNIYGPERAYQRSVKYFVEQLINDSRLQVFDLPIAGGLTLVRKALQGGSAAEEHPT
jgi:predicted O-methyltransferase YrrM